MDHSNNGSRDYTTRVLSDQLIDSDHTQHHHSPICNYCWPYDLQLLFNIYFDDTYGPRTTLNPFLQRYVGVAHSTDHVLLEEHRWLLLFHYCTIFLLYTQPFNSFVTTWGRVQDDEDLVLIVGHPLS
jgi:hypothetical protein